MSDMCNCDPNGFTNELIDKIALEEYTRGLAYTDDHS